MKIHQLLLLFSLLFLCGCERYYVSVAQQRIDVNYLASSKVGTPDPRQADPPIGQQLLISWQIPQKMLKKKPLCKLYVVYWDFTEAVFYHEIKQKVGYWSYSLLNERFFSKKGILSYRAEIVTDEEVYKKWTHQLWVELIRP